MVTVTARENHRRGTKWLTRTVGHMLALRELSRRPGGINMQQLNQSDRAETVAAPTPQSASELLARKSNFRSEGGSNDSERDVYVVC